MTTFLLPPPRCVDERSERGSRAAGGGRRGERRKGEEQVQEGGGGGRSGTEHADRLAEQPVRSDQTSRLHHAEGRPSLHQGPFFLQRRFYSVRTIGSRHQPITFTKTCFCSSRTGPGVGGDAVPALRLGLHPGGPSSNVWIHHLWGPAGSFWSQQHQGVF